MGRPVAVSPRYYPWNRGWPRIRVPDHGCPGYMVGGCGRYSCADASCRAALGCWWRRRGHRGRHGLYLVNAPAPDANVGTPAPGRPTLDRFVRRPTRSGRPLRRHRMCTCRCVTAGGLGRRTDPRCRRFLRRGSRHARRHTVLLRISIRSTRKPHD